MIKKVNKYISKFIIVLLTVSLTFLVVMLFVQVVLRYAFGSSFAAIDELGRFMFIWITSITLSLAFREGSHLGVTVITSKLNDRNKFYAVKIISFINIVFLLVLTYGGYEMCELTIKQVSPTLDISMAYIYAAIPVGAILCVFNELERLAEKYSPKKS
jgi:TRAP-type C4-dicarboxylate transport system permease small subunit